MTPTQLLSEIEEYCAKTGMAESALCKSAAGQGNLAWRLRKGQGVTLKTANRISTFIAANPPSDVAAQ